ncbi:MFS transporter [Kitasatospora sp. NPDC004289]
MSGGRAGYRSFERSVRLLMVNQFTINLGFYMLMPYLAQHLSGTLGLAGWTVGLVLGVRNLSQQGMFLAGGALADRFGYKPLIVAGLALRTVGFAVLGLVDSVPALLAASAATGLAGALFNPAVRAYVAADAGERRVEAFALFNVFYQAGILLGPLAGLALTWLDFRLTCLAAAAVFAVLSAVQVRSLPHRPAERGGGEPVRWRGLLGNRRFLLFALAMTGSYVLSFQVYLALPLEVRRIGGEAAAPAVAALFVVSGLATVLGQTRLTAWCRRTWPPGRSLTAGLLAMAAAFLPLAAAAAVPPPGPGPARLALALGPPVLAAALLTLGTMLAYPFEMDTVVSLAEGRLVATHYGLYNTVCGIGITLGNLAVGAALDLAPAATWLGLTVLGLAAAAGLAALHRSGRLAPAAPARRTGATVG